MIDSDLSGKEAGHMKSEMYSWLPQSGYVE